MKPNKTETVKVAIRVRPMNSRERKEGSHNVVDADKQENQIVVNKPDNSNDNKTFMFDYVYPPGAIQRDIYDEVAFPLVESVFEGYNGTIFAYGQTGCGKTYTMMGDFEKTEERGIIPNAFQHIFGYINSGSGGGSNKKFLVRCSFLEIYNEEIRDLLGKDCTKKLEMREDPKSGVFVKDLNIIQVKSTQEIEYYMNFGNKNKHMGETKMNQESSRSHCIFTVYIEIGENMDDEKNKKIKAGKLNLVDLAGSERQSKTQATGERLNEAKKINLSLTALSNVINALVENKSHIPYRDSKLTRLLQDSLGGNTKTVMIAAISPSSFNHDETVTTLRYAARANTIKNIPKVNQDPKDALLKQYEEEIRRLKEQCAGGTVAAPIIIREEVQNNDEIEKLQSEKNKINEEKLEMEKNLREKDEMLLNNNLEKEKLLTKLKELEKDLEKKLISGGGEDDENEKKKFKEYRENQIKLKKERGKKNKMLEEKKQQEEEAIKESNKSYANEQDEIKDKSKVITILRNKLKELDLEVRDLRYENDRDKEDMLGTIKELTKESKLYAGMIRMILTENEIKRVIELSKWKEDNEEWYVVPFSFKDKKLSFPSIKPHQVSSFIENEVSNRDLVVNDDDDSLRDSYAKDPGATRNNKFLSNNKQAPKREKTLQPTHHSNINYGQFKAYKQEESNDYSLNTSNNPHEKTKSVKTLHNIGPMAAIKTALQTQNQNNNQIIIQRRESKKLEELMLMTKKNENATSPKLTGKNRKLEPLVVYNKSNYDNGGNASGETGNNQSKSNFFSNGNKMEVSIKATVCFSNDDSRGGGGNKKIEFNPNINVNNPNIMNINLNNNVKKKLEKIPELKGASAQQQKDSDGEDD